MLATRKLKTSRQTSQVSQRADVPEWLYDDQAKGSKPRFTFGLKSNRGYPVVPKYPSKQRLAEKIARGLDALAIRYPELVREGVDAYAGRVQADNRMMLTPRSHERLLKSWMNLVVNLEMGLLSFQYTAFTVAGQKGNLKEQFERIGIPKPQNVRWAKASNQKNPGALRDLAIDVAYKSHSCGSVLRYVIAMAAINKPWPTITVDSIQGSPAQEAVSGIPATQSLICRECKTPMLARLPQRVAKKSDGESSSLNGPFLRHLYMQITLNRSKHVWCCHLLEGESNVSLPLVKIASNVVGLVQFAQNSGVDLELIGEQITLEGGVWLDLTEEVYRSLKG